jgi:hypothetical protein
MGLQGQGSLAENISRAATALAAALAAACAAAASGTVAEGSAAGECFEGRARLGGGNGFRDTMGASSSEAVVAALP